jgi:hypothetical protein
MTTCPTNRRNEVEKGLFKHGNSSGLVTAFSNDHPAMPLPYCCLFVSFLGKALLYAASFYFKLAN